MCQASPEIAQIRGEVGVVEVEHQPDAEHAGHAARHVRVAAEVEIDLPREGKRRQQQRGRVVQVRHEVDLVHVQGEVVGQRDLLEQANHEQRQAVRHVRHFHTRRLAQLREQVAGAFDGPRHQLREQRHKRRVADEAGFFFHVAAVEVNAVAHGLEDEERDADRQQDVRFRQRVIDARAHDERVERLRNEAGVLEEAEQAEVVRHAQREETLAPPHRAIARTAK